MAWCILIIPFKLQDVYLVPLTSQKEAQHVVGLHRFLGQHILFLGILLQYISWVEAKATQIETGKAKGSVSGPA